MKNLFHCLALVSVLVLSLTSCEDECSEEHIYVTYTPVVKTAEEINGEITSEAPRDLQEPGKIYFYNDYIFVNEIKAGVHIIDNTDPENPQNIAFLNIPGNVDISIKDDVLVADSYFYLLTIDITNPLNAQVLGKEEVFGNYFQQTAEGDFIVDYIWEEVTEVVECGAQPSLHSNQLFVEFAFDNAAGSSASNQGVAGSMARFTIAGDYLYAVDFHNMNIYDISDHTQPSHVNTVWIGSDIETIFPYQDKLFIGSRSGMFIYENSDPTNPTELGSFEHARACDPVFVKDNYAYVTLHSDNIICDGFTDELDLVDITDLTNPQLVKVFPMDNPHGLSIKHDNLFICEGDYGLKTFDITEPTTLDQRLLSHLEGFSTYDVIAVPGERDILLVIGDDGLIQLDFSDPAQMKPLSMIRVVE